MGSYLIGRRRYFRTPRGGLPAALAFLCAALLLALPALAAIQRVEGLEGVSSVQVFGGVEVEISQGGSAELLLRGSDSRLSPPPFYVSGDTLVLGRSAEDRGKNIGGVQYRLTLPSLEKLQVLGSADVYLRALVTPALRATLDGSGDLKVFGVQAEKVNFSVRGSGDLVVAELQADDVTLSVAGSGDLQVGELRAAEVSVAVNGSGDIAVTRSGATSALDINVVGSGDSDFFVVDGERFKVNIIGSGTVRLGEARYLDVNIMGSGDVDYRGDPDIDQTVIGSGTLRQKP